MDMDVKFLIKTIQILADLIHIRSIAIPLIYCTAALQVTAKSWLSADCLIGSGSNREYDTGNAMKPASLDDAAKPFLKIFLEIIITKAKPRLSKHLHLISISVGGH